MRDAIIAANANAGADIITLPAGTYKLTIAGTDENAAATGDLDITGDLTINGAGAATTIVDGGALDRVFDVISGNVIFNDMTIRNGSARSGDDGGGICQQRHADAQQCIVAATTRPSAATAPGSSTTRR